MRIGPIEFNWKKKETTTQVESTQTKDIHTDIVDTQTNRMMSANAQAGGLVATGKVATQDINTNSSNYIPSSSGPETIELKLNRTYSIKQGEYFGCDSKDLLHRLVRYNSSGDTKRFDKLMNKTLASGKCAYFRYSEAVRLEEISSDNKDVRVNRYSEDKLYWTLIEAIR